MKDFVSRLKEFLDNEAKSCSMDYGGVTPLYVYRCWDGTVAIEDIGAGLSYIRKTERWR